MQEHPGCRSIEATGTLRVQEHCGCRRWQDGTQSHVCSALWLWGLPWPHTGSVTAAAGGLGKAETSVSPWPPQERISQWHEQSSRYSTELRDFKNQVLGMLEAAEKEREAMRTEAESAAVRVDRLEREVDYLEMQNPAPPCVEVDETLMEKQVATAKQRKNEKYTKLTGERLLWGDLPSTPSLPWTHVVALHPSRASLGCLWHKPGTPATVWEPHPSPRPEPWASPKPGAALG